MLRTPEQLNFFVSHIGRTKKYPLWMRDGCVAFPVNSYNFMIYLLGEVIEGLGMPRLAIEVSIPIDEEEVEKILANKFAEFNQEIAKS